MKSRDPRAATGPFSCSTFAIPGTGLVGHNMDMSYPIPGVVMTNPRGLRKRSVSNLELTTGEPDGNPLHWVSEFGSITFNPFGKEFSDGGINEAGLTVNEMTLNGTVFPSARGRPVLFMSLWMQYVLDKFQSVDEVLKDLDDVTIDGWAWHFFLTDRFGNRAVVEFLEGDPVILKSEALPYPVLCNSTYDAEVRNAALYQPFGGDQPVDRLDRTTERFVHGASLVDELDSAASVDDAFSVLSAMERDGRTQWAWVLDDRSGTAYWRTSGEQRIRRVSMSDVDVSEGAPSLAIDVDVPADGDVSELLTPIDDRTIRSTPRRLMAAMDQKGSEGADSVESLVGSSQTFADRLAAYALSVESTRVGRAKPDGLRLVK